MVYMEGGSSTSGCGWLSPVSLATMVVILSWTSSTVTGHAHTKVNDVGGGGDSGTADGIMIPRAPWSHHPRASRLPLLNVSGLLEVHSIGGIYSNYCNQSEMNIWFLETCARYCHGRKRRWITMDGGGENDPADDDNIVDDDGRFGDYPFGDDDQQPQSGLPYMMFQQKKRNGGNGGGQFHEPSTMAESAQREMNYCCQPGVHCKKTDLVKSFKKICPSHKLNVGVRLQT